MQLSSVTITLVLHNSDIVYNSVLALSLHQHLARSAIGVAHDDRAALFAVD